MALLTRKKKTPTTVSEAIQPFRDVQANLAGVLKLASDRKAEAARRIADAEVYAKKVKKDETVASEAAQKELAQAEKIANALAQLLGDDAVATSGVSVTEADRAKKIASARENGTDKGEGLRSGPDA